MSVDMPAFCPKCKNIFPSGIRLGGDNRNITFKNTSSICPKCSAVAIVPDGTYDFIEDTIHVLSGTQATFDNFQRLISILEKAKEENHSPQKVAETIKREVPDQAPLANFLEKKGKEENDDWYSRLTLLVAIITIIMGIPACINESKQLVKETLPTTKQVIENLCKSQTKEPQKEVSSSEKKPKGFQKEVSSSEKKPKGFQKQPKNKRRPT